MQNVVNITLNYKKHLFSKIKYHIVMKKFFITVLCITIGQLSYALDVVYPKKNNVTVNSPTTFFIGSSAKDLTVNGENVDVHPSGGFAHFVELKEGNNEFELKSEDKTLKYIIYRPKKITGKYNPPALSEYKEAKNLEVISDNSPLRSTPVDAGTNRMAHLQKGVSLIADGEKSGFYRIKLGENNYGWISKSDAKIIQTKTENAKLENYQFIETKKEYIHIFELDKKVPFEISEGNTLKLKLFNIKDCEKGIYTFEFPYMQKTDCKTLSGYSGYYNENKFIFKVKKAPKLNRFWPLHGITITIDAGHGGKEKGAIGCLGDNEKDIVLEISKYLEKELKHRGAHVIMTRKDDSYVGLRDRVNIANNNNSDFFISIHGNALPDTMNPIEHQGTSIYYYYNQAKPFADCILKEMTTQIGTKNDKVRRESFAVVRNTDAISILIETAYLINPEDNANLIKPEFQKKCAKAIADGIVNYLK